jgi:hypothetical protein
MTCIDNFIYYVLINFLLILPIHMKNDQVFVSNDKLNATSIQILI